MPYVYAKNVTYGSTDTGGRPGRPTEGGVTVYKAKGDVISFKITKEALTAINNEYSPHTTKDILDALHIERKKLPGVRLSALQVEGAFKVELVEGTAPFDKSKEGVAGIKNEKSAAKQKSSVQTSSQKSTAKATSGKV